MPNRSSRHPPQGRRGRHGGAAISAGAGVPPGTAGRARLPVRTPPGRGAGTPGRPGAGRRRPGRAARGSRRRHAAAHRSSAWALWCAGPSPWPWQARSCPGSLLTGMGAPAACVALGCSPPSDWTVAEPSPCMPSRPTSSKATSTARTGNRRRLPASYASRFTSASYAPAQERDAGGPRLSPLPRPRVSPLPQKPRGSERTEGAATVWPRPPRGLSGWISRAARPSGACGAPSSSPRPSRTRSRAASPRRRTGPYCS